MFSENWLMKKSNYTSILQILVMFVIFVFVVLAPVKGDFGDTGGTLLVSESIIETGHIYVDHIPVSELEKYNYVFKHNGEHTYNYFPIGTPLLSVPFVGVLKALGVDIADQEKNIQIFLAAFISVGIFYLLLKIANLFFQKPLALIYTTTFWFGTSLASVLGDQLWSHNYAVLFSSIAIYLAISIDLKRPKASSAFARISMVSIGICLFLAYLCRPTFALLAPFLLLYYFSFSKLNAFFSGAILSLMLGIFVLWSLQEFHQVLPDYYLPKRLDTDTFYVALAGNLISPARGILVFFTLYRTALFILSSRQKKNGR